MIVHKPLSLHTGLHGPILFLAGSIEMGAAPCWQDDVITRLSCFQGHILNPRRDDWDASWVQSASNPQFRAQVDWELEGLESASRVLLYLHPGTQSPISLLELGLLASSGPKTVICCPDGFWRKGNVEIVAMRHNIAVYNSLDNALEDITDWLKEREARENMREEDIEV